MGHSAQTWPNLERNKTLAQDQDNLLRCRIEAERGALYSKHHVLSMRDV